MAGTDVSSATSHFPEPQTGFTSTTSGTVAAGATTVGLNSTGNYSNGDVVVHIIDPTDATKKQVYVGIVDTGGTQITGVKWVYGTNQEHASGATVVDYPDAAHIAMITKGLVVEHNQDGTHDEALITGRTEDTTPASGDYLLTSDVSAGNALKRVSISNLFDNIPAGSVETADLAANAVTVAKMGLVATSGSNAGTAGGDTNYVILGSIMIAWGKSSSFATSAGGTTKTVVFPVAFSATPKIQLTTSELGTTGDQFAYVDASGLSGSGFTAVVFSGGTGTAKVDWLAIGPVA